MTDNVRDIALTLTWWLVLASLGLAIMQGQRGKPVKPEQIDTNGLLQRIEAKIDTLGQKVSDHDEAMAKACGPK